MQGVTRALLRVRRPSVSSITSSSPRRTSPERYDCASYPLGPWGRGESRESPPRHSRPSRPYFPRWPTVLTPFHKGVPTTTCLPPCHFQAHVPNSLPRSVTAISSRVVSLVSVGEMSPRDYVAPWWPRQGSCAIPWSGLVNCHATQVG